MATDNPVEVARVQMLAHLQGLSQALRQCSDCVEHFTHTLMGGQPQPFPPHLPLNGHFPIGMAPPFIPVAQEEGKKRKRGEDAEGKKRAKKPKDPNAPKRPASSYLLFQNDVRNELKAKHPDMRNNELLSTIAKLWAEMPQSQKDEYERRNKLAKDKWLAQKAIYEGKAEAPAVAAATVPVAVPVQTTVPAPAPAPVAAATPTSSEESDEEDSDSSTTSEEEVAPPPKKSKRDSAKDDAPAKEKKHKKSKA